MKLPTLILEKIMIPVIVNIATAGIIFLVSLSFTPVRNFVFGVDEYTDYPLFCNGEPVAYVQNKERLHIEFLITNKSADDLTYVDLEKKLKEIFGSNSGNSPLIVLNKLQGVGRILSVNEDTDFNKGKGEAIVKDYSKDQIRIEVREIKKHSVLRVLIEMDKVNIPISAIDRRTNTIIPFNISEIEQNCFLL